MRKSCTVYMHFSSCPADKRTALQLLTWVLEQRESYTTTGDQTVAKPLRNKK